VWKNVRVISAELFIVGFFLLEAENAQHPSVSVSFFLKYEYVIIDTPKFEVTFGNVRFRICGKLQIQS